MFTNGFKINIPFYKQENWGSVTKDYKMLYLIVYFDASIQFLQIYIPSLITQPWPSLNYHDEYDIQIEYLEKWEFTVLFPIFYLMYICYILMGISHIIC